MKQVSLTPEGREAVRVLSIEISYATQTRVSMSDACKIALALARAHQDELSGLYASMRREEKGEGS